MLISIGLPGSVVLGMTSTAGHADTTVARTAQPGCNLVAADLPPIDGIALCAANQGRAHLLLRWLDPSLVDEHDATSVEPSLDMYDADNRSGGAGAAPLFRLAFLARFVGAQKARRDRVVHESANAMGRTTSAFAGAL